MDTTTDKDAAARKTEALQQQRDAYVAAKAAAHTYETGKKPTKAQTDEWAEKANTVIT